MPRVKDIMIDSFLSVRKKMNPNNRKNIFDKYLIKPNETSTIYNKKMIMDINLLNEW